MSNLDMLSIQASLNNGVGYYRVDSFVITLERFPGTQGPPGSETDRSDLIPDFQNFLDSGPV